MNELLEPHQNVEEEQGSQEVSHEGPGKENESTEEHGVGDEKEDASPDVSLDEFDDAKDHH